MGDNKLKMLTPERTALLILAVVLMVWALILLLRGESTIEPQSVTETGIATEKSTATQEMEGVDTLTLQSNKSTKKSQKKRQTKTKKQSSKEKPPVHHRDHLNEPVPTD